MVANFQDRIVKEVMNNNEFLKAAYRTLGTIPLVNGLSNVENNALIIGRTKAWIVNCKTCD